MISFENLKTVWDTVRDWLDRAETKKSARTTEIRSALKCIYIAALETKQYLASLDEADGQQNKDVEKSLTQLWIDAGLAIKCLNPDLANRCLLKADYWANPKRWDEGRVESSRLNVDRVYDEARALLAHLA